MKKIIIGLAFFLIFIFAVTGISYCVGLDIGELADSFQKATDLQKDQILKDNLGKEISAAGLAGNVGEYDFFDVTADIKGIYYQVSLQQQKTKNDTPYQVIFLSKDRDKVMAIDRGQDIQKDGKIIRIIDERLQIAVWIFCGELTENDKVLFKQN